ncbi:MAG: RdgB/HAM1 family non-canonical purine NTP pyrophosphatase [Dehalococcoidia bacterium]|nr:RdgB/HAM1 family non-canonical purine NTP pyrophosphatase [Dehalococcoidia bacterium]
MTKKLLVATRNSGKVREFSRMLSDMPFKLVGLDDLGITLEVNETGATFEENAVIKARAYARESGELTIADDSGLEIDSLNGEPGVLSARYGREGLDDEGRVQLVLDKMKHLPGWERTARFVAVLALVGDAVPGGVVTSKGVMEGAIIHEPIGENGFGYDPVFWLASHAKTTAQLTGEEKDEISHRGTALRGLTDTLGSLI